ncbi:MAG: RagB/SusD family nutrient uptake outer membrane protein, partial [bacterium]
IALAKLLKAVSLGELIESYQSIPVEVTTSSTPKFADRATVLATIVTLLEEAQSTLAATPPSEEFNKNILGIGFDLANTIWAMLARYALIQGSNQKALDAANQVDLNAVSSLFFNNSDARNPVWFQTQDRGFYKPVDAWREAAEPGDQRVNFWVKEGEGISFLGKPVDEFNQYLQADSPYYIYLPGEIMLIKAEAYARMGDLANALVEVNNVRTKTTDAVGLGAGLPPKTAAELPTQEAMLDEIFKQRSLELLMTGLRLGDTRRFNLPGATADASVRTRTRNWMPYSDGERSTNPNTPPDPEI